MKWFLLYCPGRVFPQREGRRCFGDSSVTRWIRRGDSAFPRCSGKCSPTVSETSSMVAPNGNAPRRLPRADVEGARGSRSAICRSLDPDRRKFQYHYLSRRQGRDARSAGAHPDPADLSPERAGLVKDVEIVGMQDVLRGVEQRALGALPARQDRRAARGSPREAGGKGRLGMEREADTHLPVLVDEVTFLLRPRHGGWVVDGTIGMGGHAETAARGGRCGARACSASTAIRRRSRARAPQARALRRPGALRHGSFRDWARTRGRPGSARRGDPARPRARRRTSSRARAADSPSRRTSHSTCASIPAGAAPRPTCSPTPRRRSWRSILFEYGEERHARRIARRIVERRGARR